MSFEVPSNRSSSGFHRPRAARWILTPRPAMIPVPWWLWPGHPRPGRGHCRPSLPWHRGPARSLPLELLRKASGVTQSPAVLLETRMAGNIPVASQLCGDPLEQHPELWGLGGCSLHGDDSRPGRIRIFPVSPCLWNVGCACWAVLAAGAAGPSHPQQGPSILWGFSSHLGYLGIVLGVFESRAWLG